MRSRCIALGCATSLALLAPAAQAQVFKCKDADGKVTYTDVPCLRSETESVVDTRSNVADHSSIRKEAARLQAAPAAPPPAPSQAASPPPPAPAPGPRNEPRTNSYYR
ncbi:MAG TPA: DUF4124 domain-containing protein [Burkholderiaceae bacterium]|nr:DUF4124 domain-containing protein [Burkholderiaceae bacterium]